MGSDQDNIVVMPLRTVQRRLTGNQDVSVLLVSLRKGASSDKVQDQLVQFMRERRRIAENEEDDFSVLDTRQIAQALSGTTRVMTMPLGAVAAVSLLEREVLLPFLVEAVVLSSLGGLAGLALAMVASIALAHLIQVPWSVDAPG